MEPEEWEAAFAWTNEENYKHNCNLDLRLGTNHRDEDMNEDHFLLCAGDIDNMVEEEFVVPAFKKLLERKKPVLKALIKLIDQKNEEEVDPQQDRDSVKPFYSVK